jgi:hypothetical protein
MVGRLRLVRAFLVDTSGSGFTHHNEDQGSYTSVIRALLPRLVLAHRLMRENQVEATIRPAGGWPR